jgi:hypothetical protein
MLDVSSEEKASSDVALAETKQTTWKGKDKTGAGQHHDMAMPSAHMRLLTTPTRDFYSGISFCAIGSAIQLREAYFVGIAAPCAGCEALAPAEQPSFS